MINAEKMGQGQARPTIKGNPAVKAAFADALPALARLEKVIETTPKNQMRDRLERIALTGRKIIVEVEADPALLTAVSRLLTYYLPRTADLAEAYAQLREKGVEAPERRSAMEDVVGKLEDAFTHYESRLVDDDFKGVDVDIRLLNEALKEDLGR
jgi:5-bromo-4-chloroindolyl phosphate hydrolysis protein